MSGITNKSCDQGRGAIVPFNTLYIPDDLWEKISSYLEEAKQVAAFIGTNLHFYEIGVSSGGYQALLEKYFPCALAAASPALDYRPLYQECGLRALHFKKLGAPFATFPQGSNFCVHENFLIVFQYDGNTKIIDIESRQVMQILNTGPINKFQIRGDFLYLLRSAEVQAWNIRTGEEIFRKTPVFCFFNPNFFQLEGNFLYYAADNKDQEICVLDVSKPNLGARSIKASAERINFQVHENCLFWCEITEHEDEEHGWITTFDLNAKKLIRQEAVSSDRLRGLKYFKVQGDFLVMVTPHLKEDGIAIWQVSTGKNIYKKPPLDKGYTYHTQGNFLIGVGRQNIKIWDIRTGTILHDLKTTIRESSVSEVHGDFLFISSFYKPAPEVWNISTGKKIGDASYPKGPIGCSGLQIDKDFLYINSDAGIITWDLMPHTSIYELGSLVRNLNILKKMADSPSELLSLLETLDPRLQWELKQYCLALTGTDSPSPKGILHMRTIVYLEILLHYTHNNNPKSLSDLLNQIAKINPDIPLKLYEILREQCHPDTSDDAWGENAFKGQNEVRVSRRKKIQAVQTLQAKLREGFLATMRSLQ
jgi:WD40 repeat protein